MNSRIPRNWRTSEGREDLLMKAASVSQYGLGSGFLAIREIGAIM